MAVKGKNVKELMKVDPLLVITVDTKGKTTFHMLFQSGRDQVLLELDQFLNELTVMFEHSSEKGSVWVTLKSSSLTSKVRRNKKLTSGEPIKYKCLVRATDGKMIISTTVGEGDQERFQASYAAILHAHMTALKKRDNKMDAEL